MKKIIPVVSVVALGAAALGYSIYVKNNNKPYFVSVAEQTTNNYLQSSYGPGHCKALSILEKEWDMTCSYDGDEISLEYSVYPVLEDPVRNGSQFVLASKNELAKESEHKGLSRLLSFRKINQTEL